MDGLGRHARAAQAQPCQRVKIHPPVTRARGDERAGCLWITRHKRLEDIRANFVRLRPCGRPQPGDQLWRRGPHCEHAAFQHAVGQPAPARMRGRHFAAIGGGQHHRQAVGGEDGQHHAGHAGDGGIGHRLVQLPQLRVRRIHSTRRVHTHHLHPVHLPQPMRRAWQAQPLCQQRPVTFHVCRQVTLRAAAVAEIEAVERCRRHAQAVPQRGQRVDARRRRPLRRQHKRRHGAHLSAAPTRRRVRCLRAGRSSAAADLPAPARWRGPARH